MNSKQGFTLIVALAVLAIIGIAAGLIFWKQKTNEALPKTAPTLNPSQKSPEPVEEIPASITNSTYSNKTYHYFVNVPEKYFLGFMEEGLISISNNPKFSGIYPTDDEITLSIHADQKPQSKLQENYGYGRYEMVKDIVENLQSKPSFERRESNYIKDKVATLSEVPFTFFHTESTGYPSEYIDFVGATTLKGGYSYFLTTAWGKNKTKEQANEMLNLILSNFHIKEETSAKINSGWKTFSDPGFGISLKYPPTWDFVVKENENLRYLIIAPSEMIAVEKKLTGPHGGGTGNTMTLSIRKIGQDNEPPTSNEFYTVTSTPTVVSKVRATSYRLLWLQDAGSITKGSISVTINLTHSGKDYEIALNDGSYEEMFNSIISTVTFLD